MSPDAYQEMAKTESLHWWFLGYLLGIDPKQRPNICNWEPLDWSASAQQVHELVGALGKSQGQAS